MGKQNMGEWESSEREKARTRRLGGMWLNNIFVDDESPKGSNVDDSPSTSDVVQVCVRFGADAMFLLSFVEAW